MGPPAGPGPAGLGRRTSTQSCRPGRVLPACVRQRPFPAPSAARARPAGPARQAFKADRHGGQQQAAVGLGRLVGGVDGAVAPGFWGGRGRGRGGRKGERVGRRATRFFLFVTPALFFRHARRPTCVLFAARNTRRPRPPAPPVPLTPGTSGPGRRSTAGRRRRLCRCRTRARPRRRRRRPRSRPRRPWRGGRRRARGRRPRSRGREHWGVGVGVRGVVGVRVGAARREEDSHQEKKAAGRGSVVAFCVATPLPLADMEHALPKPGHARGRGSSVLPLGARGKVWEK